MLILLILMIAVCFIFAVQQWFDIDGIDRFFFAFLALKGVMIFVFLQVGVLTI